MRSPEACRLGMCLARCARWFGFDRNPLRRWTDRVEAAMRLITVILLLVAVALFAAIATASVAKRVFGRKDAE